MLTPTPALRAAPPPCAMPPCAPHPGQPFRSPRPARPVRSRSDWPAERLEALRALFDQGLSHLLIAGRMGVGKGVISAKIARLGWRRTATTAAQAPDRGLRPSPILDPARMRRLEALGPLACHWPLEEDEAGVQLFCGCDRSRNERYCPDHRALGVRRPRSWELAILEAATARPAQERQAFGWDRFGPRPEGRQAPAR
ncbi:MAG: hypothetical protein QE280_06900 [Caulobacter sp.]|nr:hypothetical protein [Caulobacter sp.]